MGTATPFGVYKLRAYSGKIIKNQMGNEMEHAMETGLMYGVYRIACGGILN